MLLEEKTFHENYFVGKFVFCSIFFNLTPLTSLFGFFRVSSVFHVVAATYASYILRVTVSRTYFSPRMILRDSFNGISDDFYKCILQWLQHSYRTSDLHPCLHRRLLLQTTVFLIYNWWRMQWKWYIFVVILAKICDTNFSVSVK